MPSVQVLPISLLTFYLMGLMTWAVGMPPLWQNIVSLQTASCAGDITFSVVSGHETWRHGLLLLRPAPLLVCTACAQWYIAVMSGVASQLKGWCQCYRLATALITAMYHCAHAVQTSSGAGRSRSKPCRHVSCPLTTLKVMSPAQLAVWSDTIFCHKGGMPTAQVISPIK
jgi:hypothetical protein